MTKKTVKKNARGNTVDLQTFLTTSSVDSWAEEMEGEPTTTTPTAASTTSTGLTLDELRANNEGSHGGSRFNNNSGFGQHRENNYSRELGNSAQSKVKPSSFYSEGAPQKSSSGFSESSSFERRERRPQQQNELPTERPFVAFIGNLSFNATKDDLSDFFGESSPINISLPKDKETQRPKGYGYVEFDTVEDLKLAISLNGSDFMGRSIKIDIASPDTAAKVTVDNRDSFRGGNRREGGFRRNDNFERTQPQSVADKADNWRTGGDLDVNPFGSKKNNTNNTTRKPREDNNAGGAFGSFSSKPRYEESKSSQRPAKPSLFGEGKPWEPKEKDLKALEPNLDILSSKKKATQQKKEGETNQEDEFQTATSKPRGGRRYQQANRGGFSNNTNNTNKKATSSKKSEEEEQQDLESKNQYAALSEQNE